MNKKIFITLLLPLLVGGSALVGCTKKEPIDGAYDFVIYASDDDNTKLDDNKVIATYHIEYSNATYVTDTLKKKDNKYYFSAKSKDYLILEDSSYGLTYTKGYFKNYDACKDNKEIDVSWSLTTVNGLIASTGIGSTPLEGLQTYGFVIDGWKQ